MKNRLLTLFLAGMMILSLAACGSRAAQPTALEQGVITENAQGAELAADLLAQDYELYYLVCFGGLEQDYADEHDGYFAVTQEGFGTLDALRAKLLGVYTGQGAELLISCADAVGRPLFAEYDGRLYRSGSGSSFGMIADYDSDSITLTDITAQSCNIAFTETLEDGSQRSSVLAMQLADGAWRLAAPRITLDAPEAASGDTPRAAAQGLLSALLAGDTAQIEYYSGMPEGTYSSWRGITVQGAEIVETLYETETGGSYIAELSVKDAYGLLLTGKSRYCIIAEGRFLAQEDGVRTVVVHFQPEDNEPYNYQDLDARDDAACNMVMDYLDIYGERGFASAASLSVHDVTDFSLYMLDKENSGGTFTAEETSAAMQRYFGSDAEPSEECYSEGAGGYIFYGRGVSELRYELSRSVTKNGLTTVGVDFYTDNLQTQGHSWLVFTLAANGDGSYRFISAER